MARHLFTFSLILAAALSRLLPHPMNFAPISALALFGGVYLDKKHTFIVPLAAMLVSDYFLGFYPGVLWVYGSFALIGFVGLWLRNHRGVGQTAIATLLGSVVFFIVTNFGVWISEQVSYTHDLAGLIQCYAAAIPFFRNTLLGDVAYVTGLFGIYELCRRYVPALASEPQREND